MERKIDKLIVAIQDLTTALAAIEDLMERSISGPGHYPISQCIGVGCDAIASAIEHGIESLKDGDG